jgi:hypothetical protein
VLLCLKTETQLAPEMSCFFKKLVDGQIPKKENCQLTSVGHFLFLLDFLTLEDGTHRLSQNVCNELSLYDVQNLRREEGSCDNLVMQVLV